MSRSLTLVWDNFWPGACSNRLSATKDMVPSEIKGNITFTPTLELTSFNETTSVFKGELQFSDGTVVTAVGEDLVWSNDDDANMLFKREIMGAVCKFHLQGLVHQSIQDHILRGPDGRAVLISLRGVREETCHDVGKIPIPPGFAPPFKDYPCEEIFQIAGLIRVWQPRHLSYYNQDISATYALQCDVDGLFKHAPEDKDPISARIEACRVIIDYLDSWFPNLYTKLEKTLWNMHNHYAYIQEFGSSACLSVSEC
ncbi:hypothetical protein ABKN59_006517 [Abortiporus biennis]